MEEKLLTRVRALLAKAESTDYPKEAEEFNRKAAELIAKYGINQALLAASGRTTDAIDTMKIFVTNPYSVSKAILLVAIAESLRCRSVCHGHGRSYSSVTIVGFTSDLERVELLYTSLLLQVTTQVVHQHPDNTAFGTGESVAAYRRSWFAGFIAAVEHRLAEAEKTAAAAANTSTGASPLNAVSTELVLRDRTEQVTNVLNDLFPNVRTVTRRTSGSGHGNGYAAGRRADLGNPRVGGKRAALR